MAVKFCKHTVSATEKEIGGIVGSDGEVYLNGKDVLNHLRDAVRVALVIPGLYSTEEKKALSDMIEATTELYNKIIDLKKRKSAIRNN